MAIQESLALGDYKDCLIVSLVALDGKKIKNFTVPLVESMKLKPNGGSATEQKSIGCPISSLTSGLKSGHMSHLAFLESPLRGRKKKTWYQKP